MLWLRDHAADPYVQRAIAGVRGLYASAGTAVDAFRLTGMLPSERARVTWAQLRKREVDPLNVLAAWIAVDMRHRDDAQPDRHQEYRLVQVAKLIHRMAGGTHKRWERERADGRVEVTQLHRHPVSRGQILRVLGHQIAGVCDALTDRCPSVRTPVRLTIGSKRR